MKTVGSLIGLVVMVAVVAVVRWWAPIELSGGAEMTTMFVGFVLLAAWLSGKLFDRISLPKINGYLVLGVLIGPYVLGLVPRDQVDIHLDFANDLAISLIALTAGGEIRLEYLRGKLKSMSVLIVLHVVAVLLFGIGVLLLVKPVVPFMADVDLISAGVIASLLGVVMIASSPAVIVAMISDYRAEGPLSQTTLVVAVLKDLILIVLFATVMAVSKGVLDPEKTLSGKFLIGVGMQLFGSVAIGAVMGLVMAWYVEKISQHLGIFVVGCCLLIALLGEHHFMIGEVEFHLEALLMALSAGLLMRNIWPHHIEPLFHTMESMSLPVYCLFFTLAGARIDVGLFGGLWYVVFGLVAVRGIGMWLSIKAGLKIGGIKGDWTKWLWMSLIPQAGVSLVLVTLIEKGFSEMS